MTRTNDERYTQEEYVFLAEWKRDLIAQTKRMEQCAAMMQLLVWLTENPEVPLPGSLKSGTHAIYEYGDEDEQRERLALAARLLKPCRKVVAGFGEDRFGVARDFTVGETTVSFQWTGERAKTCTAKVVGKRLVRTRKELQAPVYGEVDELQDVIEWECEPLLGGE